MAGEPERRASHVRKRRCRRVRVTPPEDRPLVAPPVAEPSRPSRPGRSFHVRSVTPFDPTAFLRTGDRIQLSRTQRQRGHDRRAETFRCIHCRLDVPLAAAGTAHRNHCPNCLWSRHLDVDPGDRGSDCQASMEPIAITVRKDGEWILIHRCQGCGTLASNRTAGDDNPLLLVRIAVKPLAQPPFPLDRLALI